MFKLIQFLKKYETSIEEESKQSLRQRKHYSVYKISTDEITEAENRLGFSLPFELKQFYIQFGCMFIKPSSIPLDKCKFSYRFMDPTSVANAVLREYEYSYPSSYAPNDCLDYHLPFIEMDVGDFLSIPIQKPFSFVQSTVYYMKWKVFDSIEECVLKLTEKPFHDWIDIANLQ